MATGHFEFPDNSYSFTATFKEFQPLEEPCSTFDPKDAGKLLYIGPDGTAIPLALGAGLEIRDGVLVLTGTGQVVAELTVDADGNAVITGATLTVDDDGNGTLTGATLTADADGNAVLA